MRKSILAALAVIALGVLPLKAQAPEATFSFDNTAYNAASCGGSFTCYGSFGGGVANGGAYIGFTINGPITVHMNNFVLTINGGTVTSTQTLTNPGHYPAIYHVVQTITAADEVVNSVVQDKVATATLEYNWQRVANSGRGGGSQLTFPGGIKLSGSY
jgi:hypothetical protein